MQHCYLIVTADFKTQHNLTANGANVLEFATTSDGRIVCSLNAVNEFPDVFNCVDATNPFPFAWLTPADFPANDLPDNSN